MAKNYETLSQIGNSYRKVPSTHSTELSISTEMHRIQNSLHRLSKRWAVTKMELDITVSLPWNVLDLLRNRSLILKINHLLNPLHYLFYDRLTFYLIEICPKKIRSSWTPNYGVFSRILTSQILPWVLKIFVVVFAWINSVNLYRYFQA